MTNQENSTTAAVLDALPSPVPNGTVKTKGVPRKRVDLAQFNTPVVVKQPPAGNWKCDACKARGQGGFKLLAHAEKTGHRMFTDLDYR